MGMTSFARGDALAVQRWSTSLAVEAEVQQYFRKFMGAGQDNIFMVLKDLEKKPGESITYGLRLKLAGDGAEDDNIIEGTSFEEALNFYNAKVTIGQRRKSTKSKGQMSEQRIPYDIRQHGRDALAIWFAEDYDQQMFMYLSGICGAPGTSTGPVTSIWSTIGTYDFATLNPGFHFPNTWNGRAGQSVGSGIGFTTTTATAANPMADANHHIWSGAATSQSTLTAGDILDLNSVERLVALSETTDPMMQAVRVEGENKFVLLMHTFDAYNLRKNTSQNDWIDIHKNTDGKESPIYKNALGEYAGVVLHKHRSVIRYWASGSVIVSRSLFLGAQAGVIAFGGKGQYGRYSWNEEFDDRGNALVITAGSIYGMERCVFLAQGATASATVGSLFGMAVCDSACADPR